MISIEIRLWTNDIGENGAIIPKVAREAGTLNALTNRRHGIQPGESVKFRSLPHMLVKLEDLLAKHGIKLVVTQRSRRYRRNFNPDHEAAGEIN